MNKTFTTQLSHIYILDCVSSEENGALLYSILKLRTGRHNNENPDNKIECTHIPIKSKSEFSSSLWAIGYRATREHEYPLIHIEAHESECGNGLDIESKSSGQSPEIVYWSEFANGMRIINYGCRNSLIVTMAVCSGGLRGGLLFDSLAEQNDDFKGAPFMELIGFSQSELNSNLSADFILFFNTLIKTLSISEAFKELGKKTNSDVIKINAPGVFNLSMEYIIRTWSQGKYSSQAAFDKEVARMGDVQLRKKHRFPTIDDLSNHRKKLSSIEFYSNLMGKWVRDFYFLDAYPELEQKFDVQSQLNRWKVEFERMLRPFQG